MDSLNKINIMTTVYRIFSYSPPPPSSSSSSFFFFLLLLPLLPPPPLLLLILLLFLLLDTCPLTDIILFYSGHIDKERICKEYSSNMHNNNMLWFPSYVFSDQETKNSQVREYSCQKLFPRILHH